MPWNEPGGGGGNGRDPWSKGSQQPPDLDEVFARLHRRLRGIFGGGAGNSGSDGGNGSNAVGWLLLLVVVAWVAYDTPHIIDEAERGVVLRFGDYDRTLNPGLRFTWPRPVESVDLVNVSQVRSVGGQDRMLTEDENLIDINFGVQYRVSDPHRYLFNVRQPEEILFQAAESAIREVVGTNKMDFILEKGRGEIGTGTAELLQTIINGYEAGIEVRRFNLQSVQPPPPVQDAFDDVVKAREDQERFANEAEAYANKVVPEARGQAARILEQARGYKATQVAQSTGAADRFNLQRNAYQQAPDVTRRRLYLETLESVMGQNRKVLLDVEASDNLLYLPLDRLGASGNMQAPVPPPSQSGQPTGSSSSGGGDARSRGREGR